MEKVRCYLCRADDYEVIDTQTFEDTYLEMINSAYQQQPRDLVTCKNCGFVYHTPSLDEADLKTLYERFRDFSFRGETSDEYFDRITSFPPGESENHRKLNWLAPRLKQHFGATESRSILDIGCGAGVFLKTFLDVMDGWSASGVEPTRSFAEVASRRLDIEVAAQEYEPGLLERKFDFISIIQTLEHVKDPVEFLVGVADDLLDGGLVYIEVPDVRDLKGLPPDHDLFMMQHLYIFSVRALTRICALAGFGVVETDRVQSVRGQWDLRVLCVRDTGVAPDDMPFDDYREVLRLCREKTIDADV